MDEAASKTRRSILELRLVEVSPSYRGAPNWSAVSIIIDGQELVGESSDVYMGGTFDPEDELGGGFGWEPERILGPNSPLLPTSQARRVAVYTCSCGEVGCGNRAPIISETNGIVFWNDVRAVTAYFTGPDTYEEPEDFNDISDYFSARAPRADFSFDSTQYRAEIARATIAFL